MEFQGKNGSKALFTSNGRAAVVDEYTNTVLSVDYEASFSLKGWTTTDVQPSPIALELANAALTELDIEVLSANERMHTIPKAVQEEAKRALEWRKEFKRGGTPVGLNTARTLARGGQIGIKKIRHIAKYFPRHEVDKKGKGYKPGSDGYPSKGRIAWALWGGDAAKRWASAIVERENKKENSSLIASHGYYDFETPYSVDFQSFDSEMTQYMVRVRMDGSGIDRLYCIHPDDTVLVWDDGCWDDLGNVCHDIDTYDKTLDDPYDSVEKMHVPIDTEAAITIAALFDADPFAVRSMESVAPEEAVLFANAQNEMDFSTIDAIIAASPNKTKPSRPGFKTNQDGSYTPQERSQKATAQLRDALGRFAQTGSRVAVGGNPNLKGKIISQDAGSQQVKVQLDDGRYIDIAANQTQKEDTLAKVEQGGQPKPASNLFGNPIDTSGILGEPRTPMGYAAQMPGTLPPLSSDSLKTLLNDFPSWVASQRLAYDTAKDVPAPSKPSTAPGTAPSAPDFYYQRQDAPNAMNDPLLRGFLQNPKNRGWYTYDIRSPQNTQPTKSFKEVYATPQARKVGKTSPSYETGKKYSGNKTANWFKPNTTRPAGVVSAAEASSNFTSPKQSDVPPMYMAIVADDDPQAVMDLIALVPKSQNSTSPTTFKRTPGEWVEDPSILQDLNSPTPPPVILLDNETLDDVVRQIDGPEIEAARQMAKEGNQPVAAGGFYRGGKNEDALRRYWVSGRGASKVRWGSDGDFERCIKKVSMHLGARAEAYCALRRFEAVDSWEVPVTASAELDIPGLEEIMSFIVMRSKRREASRRITASAAAYDVNESAPGSKFFIPLVIPEEVESGDGRIFEKDSINLRDLPLPLLWQIKTGEGHNGSVVVGKIEKMERVDGGIGNAYGVFDNGEFGKEAERLVRGKFLRGVSADLDQFEADEEGPEKPDTSDEGKISNGRIKIKKARVMAVTLVPKPAFQECQIQMLGNEKDQEDEVVPDGVYVDSMEGRDALALIACGIVAGVIPTTPPAEWFENPKLKHATPLSIGDDGRVFGHIAAWNIDHIGMAFGTKPPRSRSNYAYFHTGVVRTEDGTDVPVGQLTLAGGHASLEASAQEAVRHYDDTASAIADVHAGEDAYGIWVAGALRPGTTAEQIRALRASAPSGDWRPIKGQLELVAVCQVNVPGFPIARARVASGQVMALVAAGATTLAKMKDDPVKELNDRIARLEAKESDSLVASMKAARSRVLAIKAEELAAKVNKAKKNIEEDSDYIIHGVDDGDPNEELAVIPRRVRKKLAEEGKALPDGSFPIRNVSDLRNAVRSYGRAKVGSRAKVRRHIVKRARSLDRPDLVPQEWQEASIDQIPDEGILASAENPCWDGYVMVGMKMVDGEEVPNCVPEDAALNEELDPFVASLRERAAIAQAMLAAGGLDRNRGNAENLRRYWTVGKGALKIRWGTPGDWKRCVRHLSKYMGVRAKGYCQLRHKEVTGVYTGSRFNPGRNNSIFSAFSEEEFGIFESIYGDMGNYMTEVTDLDMMMPLDKIMAEPDELHDYAWNPPNDIVLLIKSCGYSPSGSGPDEEDYSDDSNEDLASYEDYEDDGLLSSKGL